MFRLVSWLCLLTCLGLGVVAAYLGFAPAIASPGNNIIVEEPERDIGQVLVDDITEITYHLTNTTDRPLRVLGLAWQCGQDCCYRPKYSEEVVLPPGATVPVVCVVRVIAPVEFSAPIKLFLEDNGVRQVNLIVKGRGVLPEEAKPNVAPQTRLELD